MTISSWKCQPTYTKDSCFSAKHFQMPVQFLRCLSFWHSFWKNLVCSGHIQIMTYPAVRSTSFTLLTSKYVFSSSGQYFQNTSQTKFCQHVIFWRTKILAESPTVQNCSNRPDLEIWGYKDAWCLWSEHIRLQTKKWTQTLWQHMSNRLPKT